MMIGLLMSGCAAENIHETVSPDDFETDFFESLANHHCCNSFIGEDGTLCVETGVVPPIFPAVEAGKIIQYHNRCAAGIVEDEVQTLVSVQYDKASYEAERDRLKAIKHFDAVRLDEDSFSLPAIVCVANYDRSSEYVLFDDEASTLHYVFWQDVNLKNSVLESQYLPQDTNAWEEQTPFTVYGLE